MSRTLLVTLTLSMLFAASAAAQPSGARPYGTGGRGTATTEPGAGSGSTSTTPTPNGTGLNGGRPFGGGAGGGVRGLPGNGGAPANEDSGRGGPFTPGVDGPAGPYTPGTIDSPRTDGPFSPGTREDGWSLWSGVKRFVGGVLGAIRQVSEIIYTLDAIRNVADWFGGLFGGSAREANATLPQNGFGANPGRNDATAIGGANTPTVVRTALDSPMVVVSPSASADRTSTSTPARENRVSRTLER